MKSIIKTFIFLSFFISLITFSFQENVDYVSHLILAEDGKSNSYQYTINSKSGFPEYLSIHLLALSTQTRTPVMYFSSQSENCIDNREQMSLSQSGSTDMFIKKSQINGNKFYLCVEIPKIEKEEVPFNIEFEENSYAKIPEVDSHYSHSYYVTKNNEKMSFNFAFKQVDNAKASIFIRGNKISQASLAYNDVTIKGKQFKYGFAFSFDPSKFSIGGELYFLEIISAEGDFITIDIKETIDGKSFDLEHTSEEIGGYLKRGTFNEECFPIEKLLAKHVHDYVIINGIIYTKFAQCFFKDSDEQVMDNSFTDFTNGVLTQIFSKDFVVYMKVKYFCFGFPEDMPELQDIIYSFQIDNSEVYKNVFSPLLNGRIYPKEIEQGNLAIFSSIDSTFEKQINYNVNTHLGEIKMYFHQCNTYPLCKYSIEDLNDSTEIKRPKNINRMFTWSEVNNTNIMTPISRRQNLVIIQCVSESTLCKFDVSIFTDKEKITLEEKENYYQYMRKGEEDKYSIDLNGEKTIVKLFLDLIILSGDILMEVNENQYFTYHKYIESNKIFYSITFSKPVEYLDFSVSALRNTFYTISYTINKEQEDLTKNYLESGINYLETVSPNTKVKNIFIQNSHAFIGESFLINFYSLNCKFNIKRNDKQLEIIDYYAQDIMTIEDDNYFDDYYQYEITVVSNDTSTHYNGELCMVYVSALEFGDEETEEKKGNSREVVVSENVPQQIVFTKEINNIKYLFPHVGTNSPLFINLNLIDEANYIVKVYFNYKISGFIYSNITRSQQIEIVPLEWQEYCPDEKEACNVVIEVILDKAYLPREPMLEVFIRTENTMPAYFCKTMMRQDFLSGSSFQYFYTGVGKDEMGDIVVNFHRGSGKIYGKIVSQNAVVPETGADWRGLYQLPSSYDLGNLQYDPYLKKLYYTQEDTEECENGCYLLIGIQSSVQGEASWDARLFQITILPHSSPTERTSNEISVISVPINEYVIGNVAIATSNNIYEFYKVWLPYDGENIIIDWQSNMGNLYINLGNKKPSKIDYDFKFLAQGQDTVFYLSKKDIITKALAKGITLPHEDSIKDLDLTLGVICDVTDSVSTTLYSFKVRIPKSPSLDFVPVNTDQKALCTPEEIDQTGEYRCLFVVLYENIDLINNLIIHAYSQDPTAKTRFYGNFIEASSFENFDISYLSSNIPTKEQSTYSTDKNGQDYIFINLGQGYNKHLLVSVISDKPANIELLSSFYTYDKIITPNPSTPQLFYLQKEEMQFNFTSSKDVLVHIISLAGEAKIYWEKEPETVYYLRGKQDRLEMTLGTQDEEKVYSKLIIENVNPQNEVSKVDPGFAFYLYYDIRPLMQNFDILDYGRSTEVAYRDSDFPIVFYSRLPSFDNDVNVVLNFYEMEESSGATHSIINVKEDLFEISGCLISEENVYQKKMDPDIDPSSNKANIIRGVYDHSSKSANVFYQKDKLKEFGMSISERPYLYIIVKKTNYNSNRYKKIKLQGTILPAGTNIFAPEKLYEYGKLSLQTDYNLYRLRTDIIKRKMRIQFSQNSFLINWCVNLDKSNKNDTKIINKSFFENGKSILDIDVPEGVEELFLKVFHGEKKSTTDKLTNYVFKYMNGQDIAGFKSFKPDDSKIDTSSRIASSSLKIKFEAIKGESLQNVVYYIKLISADNLIQDENIYSMAISETKSEVVQIANPSEQFISEAIDSNDVPKNLAYVVVIAEVSAKTVREFIVYEPLKYKKGGGQGVLFWVLIGLIVIVVIASLAFGIYWLKVKQKNKDLMDKVAKTSFKVSFENEGERGDNKGEAGNKSKNEERADPLLINSEENVLQ